MVMTLNEFIERLKQLPQDSFVYLDGGYDGDKDVEPFVNRHLLIIKE